jgi:hypothetical protein
MYNKLPTMLHLITFVPDGRLLMNRISAHVYGYSVGRKNGLPWAVTLTKSVCSGIKEDDFFNVANRELENNFGISSRKCEIMSFRQMSAHNTQPIILVTIKMDRPIIHLKTKNNIELHFEFLKNAYQEVKKNRSQYAYHSAEAIEFLTKENGTEYLT